MDFFLNTPANTNSMDPAWAWHSFLLFQERRKLRGMSEHMTVF